MSEVPDGAVGFVYLITNETNSRKYVGRKVFFFTRSKKVKGRRKRFKLESDWRDYWSSSDALKADVSAIGESEFTREVLHLCYNKTQLSYYELREQVDRRVLESDAYYNEYIMARVRKRSNLVIAD